MSSRSAALRLAVVLLATLGNAAASRNTMMHITVLDSVTRALPVSDNGVPQNCDQMTFDAYCRSSRFTPMLNTLLVQEGDNPPFHISCTIESKYSRCAPLPLGATFDARREKNGITVYYTDDKGKDRKELYTLVDSGGQTGLPPVATGAAPRLGPVPTTSAAQPPTVSAQSADAGNIVHAPAPLQNSITNPTSLGPARAQTANGEKVRCDFSSTPLGAEITVDGQYVGNTPSRIALSTGTHTIVFSMDGFASWKRDLTVMTGSELNVNTTLQENHQ